MDLRTNTSLGLALALRFVAVACAAPAIPDSTLADDASGAAPDNKKAAPKKATTPASESDPSTTKSTPPPASTTPPATTAPTINTATCTAQAPDACFDCCNQGSGGALAPADNVFGQCACGTGGQCTAVCDANLCTPGGAPDAACSSCLQATCAPAETAACTSAACNSGLACAKQCN